MQLKHNRSIVIMTALLTVALTGLEAGGALTGGGAVATAATLDPPPDGGASEGQAPGDETPPNPEDEPVPPGMTRFVPPPDPDAPNPDAPNPDAPDPTAPGQPVPGGQTPGEPAPPEPARPEALPGPLPGAQTPVLSPGMTGRKVKVLQVRLQRAGALDTPVTGIYGKPTVRAVKRFQSGLGYAPTGAVDRPTLHALVARTGKVGKADIAAGENRPYGSRLAASCLTGNVVCVDKTARTVRWVVDGKVQLRLDARFGGTGTPTREGVFRIQYKDRDHVSRLYGSSMPFAMFFSGGQAVHYSSDFAARGYYGASHGCVNTRQYSRMEHLFDLAQVGDRVVVYRSRAVRG